MRFSLVNKYVLKLKITIHLPAIAKTTTDHTMHANIIECNVFFISALDQNKAIAKSEIKY